jgi:hypothetical protein
VERLAAFKLEATMPTTKTLKEAAASYRDEQTAVNNPLESPSVS